MQVRRAFLKSAALVHPDKGGTEAAFHAARAAYDFLVKARGACSWSGWGPPTRNNMQHA